MLGGPPRGGAPAGPPEPDFLAARGTMKVLAGGQPGGGGGPDLSMARTPRGGGGMGTPMNRGGGGYGSARGGYGDMSDPRGSRVQADIIAPQPELQRSENAWQRKREDDDEVQTKIKQVRSLLNKLTLEKFEKIYGQIKDIEITSIDVLYGIVAEVFQKSLSEANFAPMYADLCARLSRDKLNLSEELLKTPEEEKKALSFRRRLIKNCQMEFERFANEETIMSDLKALEDADTLSTETLMTIVEKAREKKSAAMSEFVDKLETIAKQEVIEQKDIGVVIKRAKQRMLGNVKFIGELFKQKLIPEKIIHIECIQRLTRISLDKKEDDVIEALVQLMTTTGKILASNASARSHMDAYFKEFTLLSRNADIPTRIRFLLKDLLDLRAANWHQRREETKAKTLAEIHEDIEKEERAKEGASRGGGARAALVAAGTDGTGTGAGRRLLGASTCTCRCLRVAAVATRLAAVRPVGTGGMAAAADASEAGSARGRWAAAWAARATSGWRRGHQAHRPTPSLCLPSLRRVAATRGTDRRTEATFQGRPGVALVRSAAALVHYLLRQVAVAAWLAMPMTRRLLVA